MTLKRWLIRISDATNPFLWMRHAADRVTLDWIENTRRPFEYGKTDRELFREYMGRDPQ